MWIARSSLPLAALALLPFIDTSADASPGAGPAPLAAGIYRGVFTASHFDVSPPLSELAKAAEPVMAHEDHAEPLRDPGGPLGVQDVDPAVQSTLSPNVMPGTIANFNALSNTCACTPPSPSMDVGPDYVVLAANTHLAVYNKSGSVLLGPVALNTLWAGFGGNCQNQNGGQPIVLYDRAADRWVVSQVTLGSPFALCVAVSTTGNPLGSYFRYSFPMSSYPDMPKYAVWPDAYYVSTKEGVNAGAYALDRAQMLAGGPSPQVISFLAQPGTTPYFIGDGFVPADLDGVTPPPAGSPCYFIGSMDQGGPYGAPQDALTVWSFHADFATPPNSTFTLGTITVDPFDSIFPCTGRSCIPQPGTTTRLDHLGYSQRVLPRVSYRNFGTYEAMVTNQSVEAGAGVSGIRWYVLQRIGGPWVASQDGTYAPGLTDGIHRWAGSIAMDAGGNVALGYSVSDGVSTFPGIRYTGRLVGDPLDMLPQGEATIVTGTAAQTGSRWGDYSWMAVDADDDCTFWYVNEYLPTAGTTWRLRVASFRFPSCVSVAVEEGASPERAELAVANPARGRVEIRFAVPGQGARVRLEVFDVTGRRVQALVDDVRSAGRYRVVWDGTSPDGRRRSGGVYKVRLRAGSVTETRTVVLLN